MQQTLSEPSYNNHSTKTVLLFENQYVWFSVHYDFDYRLYTVNVNFDDYCSIPLKNTSGLNWFFVSEQLAWDFVFSGYDINLYYIHKGVLKELNYLTGTKGDQEKIKRLKILFQKLGKFLKIYKKFEYLLNNHGQTIQLPKNITLTFLARVQFGSINYGSNEFRFQLYLSTNDSTYKASFTAIEVGKIYDINDSPDKIVNSIDCCDFVKLINNRLHVHNNATNPLDASKLLAAKKILEFLNKC